MFERKPCRGATWAPDNHRFQTQGSCDCDPIGLVLPPRSHVGTGVVRGARARARVTRAKHCDGVVGSGRCLVTVNQRHCTQNDAQCTAPEAGPDRTHPSANALVCRVAKSSIAACRTWCAICAVMPIRGCIPRSSILRAAGPILDYSGRYGHGTAYSSCGESADRPRARLRRRAWCGQVGSLAPRRQPPCPDAGRREDSRLV